ncbi:DUF488 domain-containing protein [Chthonomonas calidirosea]|uniref:DUF488 domain-containing protein n=1 Tax=Chthonomonas calidirosea TaxID=454171 RepID=UPI0006EC91CC|nr:DUF488 domain-containing protein [Chthonomonas calidirosea]CEK15152.1 hypothetical protein CP488_01071 [Chthonomonas calidirosea]
MIKVKRVYEPEEPDDGKRYLVERLWPRGIKREALHIYEWLKELAPSPELRQWFGHDPSKWSEFQQRYRAELARADASLLQELVKEARQGNVTLLYSARDTEHNNALVLKSFLEEQL